MMDYYLGEHMVIWFSMIFYKESVNLVMYNFPFFSTYLQ